MLTQLQHHSALLELTINLINMLRKYHPLLKILNGTMVDLPCPVNISSF